MRCVIFPSASPSNVQDPEVRNAMTKNVDLDQCGDETSWGHAGYSDVTSKIHHKPNVSKGGQTVITCDVGRNYPRVYCHRHNYMDHPDGVTAKGQAEVINVAKQIEKMVMTEEGEGEGEGEGTEAAVTEGKENISKQNLALLLIIFSLVSAL